MNYGWLIQFIHANGAAMMFLAVYIHMFRGIYYGSYKAPREVLWLLGMVIYFLMMATAFMGYVLPWGQMSFWAATVITNIFGAIPVVGPPITTWLWGGFAVDDPTLNRFYSLHYLLPFVIAAWWCCTSGRCTCPATTTRPASNVKDKTDTVPFHPYYTVKDGFGLSVFMVLFAAFVFFAPDAMGHADNYIPANPLVTPQHIVPEWYLLPYYAMLRAVPNKLLGVITLGAAIGMLFVLPWIDTSKVRSMRYRPIARWFFFIFIATCLVLGWCGAHEPDATVIPGVGAGFTLVRLSDQQRRLAVAGSALLAYFGFFASLFLVPMFETPLPMPESISEPVLSHPATVPAGAAAAAREEGLGPDAPQSARPRGGPFASPPSRPAHAGDHRAAAEGRALELRRAVRPVRPGAAAARLQGLPRRLLGLPFDEPDELSRTSASRAGRSTIRSIRTRTTIRT